MATTEIGFNEGKNRILSPGGGMPSTSHFMLVTDPVAANPASPAGGELYAASVYADVHEVSWTGSTAYARKSVSTPSVSNGIITYALALLWQTSEATNGPSNARTLVLLDNAGSKLIYAWDVPTIIGTTAAMNAANASLDLNDTFQISFFLQNVGGN